MNVSKQPSTSTSDPSSHRATGPRGRAAGDRVYDYVREEILSGAFAPGTVLKEVELSKRCGVSRTPVREALQRLEAEQWVRRDPRVGLTVASPTTEEVFESLTIFEALEGMAARLAAQRLTDVSEARLRLLHEGIANALANGDRDKAVQLSAAFHRVVWSASGNKLLESHLQHLEQVTGNRMRRYGIGDPDRATVGVEEHAAVLAAIVSRNPDQAEETMRAHLRAGREFRIAMSLRETGLDV